jgi:hypothetical protein
VTTARQGAGEALTTRRNVARWAKQLRQQATEEGWSTWRTVVEI